MKKPSILKTYLMFAILLFFIVTVATVLTLTGAGEIHSVFGVVIVIGTFFIVDIVFWIKVIQTILRKRKDKKALQCGVVYDATYLSHILTCSVNGVGFCKITYSCNINGEIKEFTTDSEYSFSEAMALKEKNVFKVKVCDIHSVIVEDLNNINHTSELDYVLDKLQEKRETAKIICEYCGSKYNESEINCPKCGANSK